MKVAPAVSADIIDRRRRAALWTFGGIVAALLGALGIGVARGPDPDADLVSVVSAALDRGQAFWATKVQPYRKAHVVLYEDGTPTACGKGETADGPFYCPGDERIYIDLSFLRAIRGDLARAYVVAHELGHHIEKLRGEINGQSVPVELGADCYAGVWMASENAAGDIDGGDIEAALAEAAAVGDDRLCPTCSPEQWTHGSAQQRTAAVSDGIAGRPCHL